MTSSVQRGRLTEEDYDRLARCRREHTRLGLAYQIVFYRLTGRLPRQRPFKVAREVLVYEVADLSHCRDDLTEQHTRV